MSGAEIFLGLAVVAAAGSVMGGIQAKSQADKRAEQLAQAGEAARRAGAVNEAIEQRKVARAVGRGQAIVGSSGLTAGGSPLGALNDVLTEGTQSALMERWKGQVQAAQYGNAASAERARGRSALMGGIFDAVGGLAMAGMGYMTTPTPVAPGGFTSPMGKSMPSFGSAGYW